MDVLGAQQGDRDAKLPGETMREAKWLGPERTTRQRDENQFPSGLNWAAGVLLTPGNTGAVAVWQPCCSHVTRSGGLAAWPLLEQLQEC